MASPSKTVPSASTSTASRTAFTTTRSQRSREENVPPGHISRAEAWPDPIPAPSSGGLAVDDDRLAAEDRVAHPPGESAPGIGRVAGFGCQLGGIDDPRGAGIDDAQVGRAARFDGAAVFVGD